ncbi:MAG: hypothetical protein AAGA67_10340 [Cyanobacteria bacterium P01_F01_bin.153]
MMSPVRGIGAVVALLFAACSSSSLPNNRDGIAVEVIDGKTIEIQIDGTNQPVKLCGVAPKPGAKAGLEKLVSFGDHVAVYGEGNHVEVFVPQPPGSDDADGELHLNAELLARGVAGLDRNTMRQCPNAQVLKSAFDPLPGDRLHH